jgi:hypothetical protein
MFIAGRLIKAERGRLIALTREKSEHEIALVRHELAAEETAELVAEWGRRCERLRNAFHAGVYSVRAEVPAGANVDRRVLAWLKSQPAAVGIAAAPNVR